MTVTQLLEEGRTVVYENVASDSGDGSMDCLDKFPRFRLLDAPTQIVALDRLSEKLGGPRIWMKRDDVSPLIGGNKLRKLELFLGAALAQKADTIMSSGALQSNHARLTAVAAIKAGLTCQLVLRNSVGRQTPSYESSGNRLLEALMGCEVKIVGPDAPVGELIERRRLELEREGRNVFVVPFGGSNGLGNLGYVTCALELARQQIEMGRSFSHLFVAAGSGGTQAGLVVGKHLAKLSAEVVGVTVVRARAEQEEVVRALADETLKLLGHKESLAAGAVLCDDGHYLPGYGQPNEATREAILLCARLEGVLLDPVYTGKAMAGLIRWVREGRFGPADEPLFIHTGGLPGLFAYDDYFTRVAAHERPDLASAPPRASDNSKDTHT
jgi:D-cysteine desulfhydrase/L-cysteate sulfo-lyase